MAKIYKINVLDLGLDGEYNLRVKLTADKYADSEKSDAIKVSIFKNEREKDGFLCQPSYNGKTWALKEYTGTEKNVIIPSTFYNGIINEISSNAFQDMGLTSVVIPNTIETISDYAFCKNNFTEIIFPDSVKSIAYYSFGACPQLKNIKIGNKMSTIGQHAFMSCSALETIFIPKSVNIMGFGVFSNCKKLTKVCCEATFIRSGWSTANGTGWLGDNNSAEVLLGVTREEYEKLL